MKTKIEESEVIVKIQNSNDGRNKSLSIYDAKYEQDILKRMLNGKEPVRTDGDRELGRFY